ncbi:DHS-like NAD/FAD-binding domain-containing protein [Leucosporidium creatinivorum]|uniref:DHS-like NAD/FAD-binding domain-containing protein n=1 Tax=Leucosporidium creatinivorum TaxID=106004 RepID=A0A1Y2EGD2_9BASI|nr:DHS-like NAD/FAD-binding domain-containing protein [Leucosporidium creatinivorum]
MPSELDSTRVVETVEPHNFPPLPPGASFQDIDSESGSEDGSDEEDWDAILAASEAAFSQDEADAMISFLKERGLFAFVKHYVEVHQMPIPKVLLAFGVLIPPEASLQDQLRVLKVTCSRVLRARDKLEAYNTVDDAVALIAKSKKILVLTGAGVSTSCGIPDFRSPTGLYARLKEEHWELDDPQQMFDLPYFKEKPNVFYSFAKEIYPSNFVPSPCHRFVKMLENNEKLLRNYTQNIDGLFEQIGVKRMLNCHGSFATASCLRCRTKFPGSAIEADVFASRVPLCPLCTAIDEEKAKNAPPPKKSPEKWSANSKAFEDDDEDEMGFVSEWEGKPLVKPDIVFFGEMLSDEFDHRLLEDREEVDLLIVIGTSLRVSPVSQIVSHLPHSIPQILINRDPVGHANFDIVLLGDGDTIVKHLCSKLGDSFNLPAPPVPAKLEGLVAESEEPKVEEEVIPERVSESHVWLFPGANREARWVQLVRQAYEEGEENEEDDTSDLQRATEGGLRVPLTEGGSRSRSRSPEGVVEGASEEKRVRLE